MIKGAVIQYTTPAGRAAGCGCGDSATQVPNGQPVTTRVGPLDVTTTAPCQILARIGGLAFAVPCAVTITNRGKVPVAVMAQAQSGGSLSSAFGHIGGKGLRGMVANLPTAIIASSFTVDTLGPVRIDPGQSVSLPAPPVPTSGQGYWTVIDIDPQAIQRTAWVVGGVAVVAGAGVVYGAVRAIGHSRRKR